MSAENVELVRRLQPRPELDLAATMRDPDSAQALLGFLSRFLDPDCEVVIDLGGGGEVRTRSGPAGMWGTWLEWMAPWASYRTEVEELVDLGDRVLVLVYDYGRYEPGGPEVRLIGGAIWTVRDQKVTRAEFYIDRDTAFRKAGVAE